MNSVQSYLNKANVLIVDITSSSNNILNTILEQKGCIINYASSGEAALNSAKKNPPDIIILKIDLPLIDGYKICENFKSYEKFKETPVIFICTADEPIDKNRIFNCGGSDYLVMPFNHNEVLSRVEAQLKLRFLQQQSKILKNNVKERTQQLEDITTELKEFNVILDEEITERTKTEEALKESERQLRKSLELQKKAEEERKKLYEIAEYDKIKTEFFSNISHELRTPINVIFSALQVHELKLKECSCNDTSVDIFKYTKIMKQNCFRLLRLINNLIDITKIDSGYFDIDETNNNIISLVEDITMSVADYIKDKGLSLIFDTDVEEKVIACDPEKIERIIINLLSNAVKFTPCGGKIMVNVEDGNENICLRVKDTGRGIPEDKLKIIFERFVQVDKSLTRDHEGSGIGLSLVKALVELHGGTISVKSKVGYGSEFIIHIPCRLVKETNDKAAVHQSVEEKHIEKINIEFSDIYN